jgi:hypothetical protein
VGAPSFNVSSDTQITAVSPPGTGTVDVEVIAPAANRFVYVYLPPPPVVTSAQPPSGLEGDPVTITGSGFTGATAVRFGPFLALGVMAQRHADHVPGPARPAWSLR